MKKFIALLLLSIPCFAQITSSNIAFVGDSITCGVYSTTACQNSSGTTPTTIPESGYILATTGTATSGSTALTVASGTGILAGQIVVGAGVLPNTLVQIVSGTSVTLTQATYAAMSATAVSFGNMDYPSQAMRRQALANHANTAKNFGVAGWKVSDITSDYATHVHPFSPAVTGTPGYMFLQIGTNDILQGVSTATYEAGLLAYWQTAKKDGWTVIALTIPPGPWSADQFQYWNTWNDWIRANSGNWDRIVDGVAVLSNNYDYMFFTSIDAIHPINAGYSILAQLVGTTAATGESILQTTSPVNPSSGAGNYGSPVGSGYNMTNGGNSTWFGQASFRYATSDYNDAAFGQGTLGAAHGSHDNAAFGHYTQANVINAYNIASNGSFACNGVTSGHDDGCFGANADVSTGGAIDRYQLGHGTNTKDGTLQYIGINFIDEYGNVAVNTLKQSVGLNVASASTITPSGSTFHITGANTIQTINVPSINESNALFTGCLQVFPDGAYVLQTGTNIGKASTAAVGRVMELCYDGVMWYPSY